MTSLTYLVQFGKTRLGLVVVIGGEIAGGTRRLEPQIRHDLMMRRWWWWCCGDVSQRIVGAALVVLNGECELGLKSHFTIRIEAECPRRRRGTSSQ